MVTVFFIDGKKETVKVSYLFIVRGGILLKFPEGNRRFIPVNLIRDVVMDKEVFVEF